MNGRAAAGQTCRRRRSGSAAGVEEARVGKKQKDDEAEERKQAGGSRQEKEACGERSRQKNEAEGRRTRQKDSRRKQAEGRRGRRTTRQKDDEAEEKDTDRQSGAAPSVTCHGTNDATVTSPQRLALPPLPPPLPPPPPPPLPLPLAPLALSSVCALAHSPSHVVLKPPALLIRALCSTMCYEVPCRKCGKKTWAGCGQHKDAVIAAIPKDQRCACAEPEPDAGGCTVS